MQTQTEVDAYNFNKIMKNSNLINHQKRLVINLMNYSYFFIY